MNTAHQPWLATYHENGIAANIDADAFPSVVALMEEAMRTHAERIAFRSYGHSLTYAEIDRLSGDFAAWLQQVLKVKKGDRIAVMLPNILAFPIAFIGIARVGAVQVNINPQYTPHELAHQLKDAGAEIIVVFHGAIPTLAEVIADTSVATVIAVGEEYDAHVDSELLQTISVADALRVGKSLARVPLPLSGSDLLLLQYTGGTSGRSKGAMLSHRNLVANTEQFKAMNCGALRPGEEVLVTAIPMYHIFALMVNFISYFSVGAENWLVDNPRDLRAFINVLRLARPTVFVGVNTLYASLVAHPRIGEADFSRLRIAVGGGAPVVRGVSDSWQRLTGIFIREGYGLTETSPVVTFAPPAIRAFSGNTGVPMPGTDVRLLDDLERDVAPGQPGEVCVKGPQVMRGYWRQSDANAFTADGYFKTGDIGVFDSTGFLQIVDRKKDMVIVSGFNVYPNEVDAIAGTCPGVAECACIGVPDEKSGEALMLFVVEKADAALRAEDVIAHCRNALTAYKVPKIVRVVDSLPKSTVGKILRRELLRSVVPLAP